MHPFGDPRWKKDFPAFIHGSPSAIARDRMPVRHVFRLRWSSSRSSCRAGFTLLELLIVLGLLATLTAMVWPRMQRRIARSQLKQLAIDLKEEIAEARSRAIRAGMVHELRFQLGGGEYWIGPRAQLPPMTFGQNVAVGQAGAKADQPVPFEEITVSRQADHRGSQAASARPWIIHKQLDESVYLADADQVSNLIAAEQTQSVRPDLQRLTQTAETISIGQQSSAVDSRPAESILLTPDGRAEDRQLALCDRRLGLGIRVTLRGLTGQVEIGDFFAFSKELEPSGTSAEPGEVDLRDADFPDDSLPPGNPSRALREDDWE